MGTILLAGLLIVVLAAGAWMGRRKQAQTSPVPSTATSSEAPKAPVTALDKKMVEAARAKHLSSFKKLKEVVERLSSEDYAILKAVDLPAYVAVLQQGSSKAWVAIIREQPEGFSVVIWLPNLRGTANLFDSHFDKDGTLGSVGATMSSSMILGEAGGGAEQPSHGAQEQAPLRESFGFKSQWLAIKTDKPRVVADLLKLKNVGEIEWNEGVGAAYGNDRVFITPPVNGWTIALDTSFVAFGDDGGLLDDPETLARWSATLKTEVQHFACDRRSGSYGWMRAANGKLLRAFFEVEGEAKTNLGTRDADEQQIAKHVEQHPADDGTVATEGEDMVFQLAGRWSVDPHLFDQLKDAPAKGLVGDVSE